MSAIRPPLPLGEGPGEGSAGDDDMIAFATLFLGLILGVREVELVAGEEVAAIEVLLNDRLVGSLTAPPWKLDCDFGRELKPQDLVAVAYDAGDHEIGRVRQWINLPQSPAQVTVTLTGDAKERVAHLVWESLAGAEPIAVAVSFDGVPLVVVDPRRVPLPPHDDRQLHFLRAELDFAENVTSVAEVAFGGAYSDQVSLELTAVPVHAAKKSRVRKRGALDGFLVKHGSPLGVVAVEQGTAQIVMVPDRGVRDALQAFNPEQLRRPVAISASGPATEDWGRMVRAWASFRNDQFVRFLWPVTQHQSGSRQDYDLFPRSHAYGPNVGGLFHLLRNAGEAPYTGVERLADAVAVAGLHAAEQRQRRAVVLLLGRSVSGADPSQLTVEQTRRYLEHLRVPFAVWTLAADVDAGEWGPALDASTFDKLDRAVDDLAKRLDQQWLVWIDGIHLPQDVALSPRAEGVELVR